MFSAVSYNLIAGAPSPVDLLAHGDDVERQVDHIQRIDNQFQRLRALRKAGGHSRSTLVSRVRSDLQALLAGRLVGGLKLALSAPH